MCTVTFIPFGDSFFLTSNRDESPSRQARGLSSIHHQHGPVVHFPLDPDSGGSWIALNDSGRAVCLLNGGFVPFTPTPPYRKSRGQVVLDAGLAQNVDSFVGEYALDRIAPFTLLIFEKDHFIQLVWDGQDRHISPLPVNQFQLWSSVTLYPPEVRQWRKQIFDAWTHEHQVYDRESIMAFHCLKKGDAKNDFIMNRNEVVKTLSVTSIQLQSHKASMVHIDLEKNTREEVLIRHAG